MSSKMLAGLGGVGALLLVVFAVQWALRADAREEKALVIQGQALSDFLESAHSQNSLDQACRDLRAVDARLLEIAIKTQQSHLGYASLRYCPQKPVSPAQAQ